MINANVTFLFVSLTSKSILKRSFTHANLRYQGAPQATLTAKTDIRAEPRPKAKNLMFLIKITLFMYNQYIIFSIISESDPLFRIVSRFKITQDQSGSIQIDMNLAVNCRIVFYYLLCPGFEYYKHLKNIFSSTQIRRNVDSVKSNTHVGMIKIFILFIYFWQIKVAMEKMRHKIFQYLFQASICAFI